MATNVLADAVGKLASLMLAPNNYKCIVIVYGEDGTSFGMYTNSTPHHARKVLEIANKAVNQQDN